MTKVDERDDAIFFGRMKNAGLALEVLDQWLSASDWGGVGLMELRLEGPNKLGSGYRLMVKATDEGGRKVIDWHVGESVTDCVQGFVRKAKESGVKWKEDKPYDPNKSKEGAG